jgi:hypothetical protein
VAFWRAGRLIVLRTCVILIFAMMYRYQPLKTFVMAIPR